MYLCALMWKSEEVKCLRLLLSTLLSGEMVHHEPKIPHQLGCLVSELLGDTCVCLQMLGLHSYVCLFPCFYFHVFVWYAPTCVCGGGMCV